ncbi:MAG: hypothetical protein A2270_02230 [Elusimicrobia bacterium RIFOXYA12_FULL_51_18]|nr:MAG: hypothetical protein A2270_02230 [Elusimicrobia bacterium RIFOXYA12_FULL_51_18]OGS28335.1 MAG: hypothetical protein A2218_00080 [Elusimicrobia bacterium RIFOXYA2_FULL_53_38]
MSLRKSGILYVIENDFFGGGEQAFAHLINGLDGAKFNVYAACLTGSLNPASVVFTEKIRAKARVIPLDLRRRINPFKIFLLKKIVRAYGIDVVHSQGPRADFYARLAARLAGGVAVVSTVAVPVEEYNVGALRKAAYKVLNKFGEGGVDKFIAVAGHIGKKLAARGIPPEKVQRIYNGIPVEEFVMEPEKAREARRARNIGEKCFLAAAFCRLSWEKGLFSLIDAAKVIAGGDVPAGGIKYLIAGEGPLEKDLKARIKNLGLENSFIFTGFLDDVKPLLSAADVVVLPSFREGFPVGVLEAMAMGKPVIASDIDGINESVSDGQSGLLVPPGNAAALAGAITALFKCRERAFELGRRGRAVAVERFGVAKMVKAHEELYGRLL